LVEQITLDQLDDVLDRADALIHVDYNAAMQVLNGVAVNIPLPPSMSDPFSQDYADWVMATYLRLARLEAYEPSIHEADRNVTEDIPFQRYFPFNTRDVSFIGRYLTGVGMVLTELALQPGSCVVEYGVGWGHVSTALARAGHRVICVDIEPKFLQLVSRQAESMGCTVATHRGAFGDSPFAPDGTRADAVIFFEAFHHAFDHLDVLRRLRHCVLRSGGVLVLAAEPVHPEFPVPWGIRPDGHALWAVRRHKWMELGFQEDYLLRALLREGFLVSRTRVDALGSFGVLYRAQLHDGRVCLSETLLPGTEAASWAPVPPTSESCLWAQVDSRVTLDGNPKWISITVMISNHLPVPLNATMDAGGAGPAIRHRFKPGEQFELRISLPQTGREIRVWSETASPAELGINSDRRSLGVAVQEIRYHAG
jgi:SAM-dependent methyltransferase